MAKTYSISDLAREFDITPRALRHYEDEGLLTPLRVGQRRVYRPRDRVRLKLILRGRRLGFALPEIREIIGLYDTPAGEAGQLRTLLARVAERRADLEAKRRDIEAAIQHLDGVAAGCRAQLADLGEAAIPETQAVKREVGP